MLLTRLLQVLLILALDMIDDDDNISVESPREIVTTINTITAPMNDTIDTLINRLLPVA